MKYHAKFLRHGQKCYCWLRRSELAPLILEQKTRHHPSASHAPKKSNFCRASVTPKRSGAVSSIHTSKKHAANRKFQSYDLHSDKHSSCFRWPKNKTLRTWEIVSFWWKERNTQRQSLHRTLCSCLRWVRLCSILVAFHGVGFSRSCTNWKSQESNVHSLKPHKADHSLLQAATINVRHFHHPFQGIWIQNWRFFSTNMTRYHQWVGCRQIPILFVRRQRRWRGNLLPLWRWVVPSADLRRPPPGCCWARTPYLGDANEHLVDRVFFTSMTWLKRTFYGKLLFCSL